MTNFSIHQGIEKTKRGKFEGGDSAWEEDKLKSYSKSEVRLTEIQENLCKDVERGEDQCHTLAGELEQTIEDWWFHHQTENADIYTYICIEHTKTCCPKDHFGAACTPCQGFPDKVCSNNGKCKGSGTRKGNGQCACDRGYTSTNCEKCAFGHYESYRDENKLLCSTCHAACAGACKGAGPADCLESCKEGWQMMGERGCQDINECLQSKKYCPGNQFCVNKEGNYSCLGCDRACDGCSGDGPDMCTKCAEGYEFKDNICISKSLGRRNFKKLLLEKRNYRKICCKEYSKEKKSFMREKKLENYP